MKYKIYKSLNKALKSTNYNRQVFLEPNSGEMIVYDSVDRDESLDILFCCNTRGINIGNCIYIVGNLQQLGNWIPNKIKMYDDGTHGDEIANDEIWSLTVKIPGDMKEIKYKFTNSGLLNTWQGEEFPGKHRIYKIPNEKLKKIKVSNYFSRNLTQPTLYDLSEYITPQTEKNTMK